MLKRVVKWFKKESQTKRERQEIIKQWFTDSGIEWSDIENLLFWNDPRISLAAYIIFTLCFWKFLLYRLQCFTILIVGFCVSVLFNNIRLYYKQYMLKNLQIAIREENRTLGFNLDDACECAADIWTQSEEHYKYLVHLKETYNPKLVLYLIGYICILVVILKHIPVAQVLFLQGTFLYFLPILTYLGISDKIVDKVDRLFTPITSHWMHNKTKRRRNRLRKLDRLNSPKKQMQQVASSSDTDDKENDEFLPERSHYTEKVLTSMHEDSFNESFDEFDLRGQQRVEVEENSSDYDEDAFVPSYNFQPGQGMPSLSQFDSMMEPLNDDFYGGLDFKNVSATTSANFGIPSNYQRHHSNDDVGQDTDEDVEDIPVEQADGVRFARVVTTNENISDHKERGLTRTIKSDDDVDETSYRDRQEYEFLDRTELHNVTDEEINEQAIGQTSISKGVSTFLGY